MSLEFGILVGSLPYKSEN